MSYEKILAFCQAEKDEAQRADGSVAIKGPVGSLTTAFDITRFFYSEFRAACVGLCFTMNYRGMHMAIRDDQKIVWDTLGRHLLDPPSLYFSEDLDKPFPEEDHPFRDLFVTAIKTATGEWQVRQAEPLSKWRWFQWPLGMPADRFAPAAYLAYPLLEAVLKRRLNRFVSKDGQVSNKFVLPHRTYNANKVCSSVRDLLILLQQEEKSTDLGSDVKQILDHVAFLYPNDDPLTVIAQKWRNPAMHGADCVNTAYGIILNIVLLISMAQSKVELSTKLGE